MQWLFEQETASGHREIALTTMCGRKISARARLKKWGDLWLKLSAVIADRQINSQFGSEILQNTYDFRLDQQR